MNGTKRVEFRRRAFAHPVSHVIVYATAPTMMVVGSFSVEQIVEASPNALWKQHGGVGLITRERFMAYFAGRETGYAIRIGAVRKLKKPISLRDLNGAQAAPQSFTYVDSESAKSLFSRRSETLGSLAAP